MKKKILSFYSPKPGSQVWFYYVETSLNWLIPAMVDECHTSPVLFLLSRARRLDHVFIFHDLPRLTWHRIKVWVCLKSSTNRLWGRPVCCWPVYRMYCGPHLRQGGFITSSTSETLPEFSRYTVTQYGLLCEKLFSYEKLLAETLY